MSATIFITILNSACFFHCVIKKNYGQSVFNCHTNSLFRSIANLVLHYRRKGDEWET